MYLKIDRNRTKFDQENQILRLPQIDREERTIQNNL